MSVKQAPEVRDERVDAAFCLLTTAWIPVLRGGTPAVVSLVEAVEFAHEIDDVNPVLPTQGVAILRQVLLPLVLDVFGPARNAQEWRQRFQRGAFVVDEADRRLVQRYVGQWRHRFDLFDPVTPFAQVGGMRTVKGGWKSPGLMVPTAASGNNVPLFSAFTEGDSIDMSPADAALWLLHTHCWDTAAIKTGVVGDSQAKAGKTTGNPVGPLGDLGVVVPVGANLFETLVLNMPIMGDSGSWGEPQWKQAAATPEWAVRPAVGLMDLLTWQSRRVRLIPEVLGNEVRVVGALVAAGDRLTLTPEYEPHTLWRSVKEKKRATVLLPARHRPGRAAWRGLSALLAVHGMTEDTTTTHTSALLAQIGDLQVSGDIPEDYLLQVQISGMAYGNQKAVVDDMIDDRIPLPVLALVADSPIRDLVLACATTADELATAINYLSADLRRSVGGDPIPWNKGQRPGEQLIHGLDRRVRALLAALQRQVDADVIEQGHLAWEQAAWQEATAIAERVLSEFPPAAFRGRGDEPKNTMREAIASARFNHRLRTALPRAADTTRKVK